MKNKRLGLYPPTKTPDEKRREQYEKDRAKRKRCRDNNKDQDSCKFCSQAYICSREATQEMIMENKTDNDDKPSVSQ